MIWREKGVQDGSYMCFFNPADSFKEHFYYMYSCGFFSCDKDYSVSRKGGHPHILIYITSGELILDFDGCKHTAHTSDILLINCKKPHRYYCPESCEFLFFHYDGRDSTELTDYLCMRNDGPLFHGHTNDEIYQLIREPIMSLCYQENTSDSRLSSIVYHSLLLLQSADDNSFDGGVHPDIVAQTDAYIKKNINRIVSVSELAKEIGLSPYYYSRLFKDKTGYSPIEYASMMKINYAKLMLRTTSSTISEIADNLGYSSEASFINAFRARRGISPSKYRKQHEKKNET